MRDTITIMNELNAVDSIAGHIAFSFSDLQVIAGSPRIIGGSSFWGTGRPSPLLKSWGLSWLQKAVCSFDAHSAPRPAVSFAPDSRYRLARHGFPLANPGSAPAYDLTRKGEV